MTTPSQITAVILAGGRARRMQGRDKGLIELSGKPLIQYVIDTIKSQVNEIFISANRNIEEYKRFDYQVLSDVQQDFPGPLAGIAAAFQQCKTEYLLVVPCDTPFLPTNLASSLLTQLKQDNVDVCIAHDGNRLQPLVALLSRSLGPKLDESIQAGHLKVERWMLEQTHCIARFSTQNEFININNEDELLRAEQLLQTKGRL